MKKHEWMRGLSPIQKAKLKLRILSAKLNFRLRLLLECQLEIIKTIRLKKWNFIKRAVFEYYNTLCPDELELTTAYRVKKEMKEKIRTVDELNYWFNKVLKWRIEQWVKV